MSFLERLVCRLSLNLPKGFIHWLQFLGHVFELDNIDKEKFSLLIVGCGCSHIGIILVIWLVDVINPPYLVGGDIS